MVEQASRLLGATVEQASRLLGATVEQASRLLSETLLLIETIMYEIETERLLLRQFSLADVDDIYAIYSRDEVMKYVGKIRTREELEKYIEKMLKSWEENQLGMWAIAWKNEAKILGDGGLCFLDGTPP